MPSACFAEIVKRHQGGSNRLSGIVRFPHFFGGGGGEGRECRKMYFVNVEFLEKVNTRTSKCPVGVYK